MYVIKEEIVIALYTVLIGLYPLVLFHTHGVLLHDCLDLTIRVYLEQHKTSEIRPYLMFSVQWYCFRYLIESL